MNKSDLKTGMWVELRDGTKYMVLCNVENVLQGEMDFMLLAMEDYMASKSFEDDLHCIDLPEYDIMKVLHYSMGVSTNFLTMEGYTVLWERNEKTYAQDFLEKFQNCSHKNGVPNLCRHAIYGASDDICGDDCVKCWNEIMK